MPRPRRPHCPQNARLCKERRVPFLCDIFPRVTCVIIKEKQNVCHGRPRPCSFLKSPVPVSAPGPKNAVYVTAVRARQRGGRTCGEQ
jgi:hypothetical protein